MSDVNSRTHKNFYGKFAEIFDKDDFLSMLNTNDESTVVLKGHLIVEDFLNVWSSLITSTEDLYAGGFVNFKTKINISKNLGLPDGICRALEKINDIRNRYSHRRKYRISTQEIDALRKSIDNSAPGIKVVSCEEYTLESSGLDENGVRRHLMYDWKNSDSAKKLFIMFVTFLMKLVFWIQGEFSARGIGYPMIQEGEDISPWRD